MTAERMRPLVIAGVAGGVGTTTFSRIVATATGLPVADHGRYGGGLVDVLVTSTTAAAASNVGPALALCPRRPVLVVMHTVPGVVVASRSYLRQAEPHIVERFDIAHRRAWLEMRRAPDERLPASMKDVHAMVARLPEALRRMYAEPVSRPAGPPGRLPPVATHRRIAPNRHPSTLSPQGGAAPRTR